MRSSDFEDLVQHYRLRCMTEAPVYASRYGLVQLDEPLKLWDLEPNGFGLSQGRDPEELGACVVVARALAALDDDWLPYRKVW